MSSHQTHSPEKYHFFKQNGKIQLLASSYLNILKITFVSIDWQPYNLVHELLHFGYKITNLVKFEYTKLHNTEDFLCLTANNCCVNCQDLLVYIPRPAAGTR